MLDELLRVYVTMMDFATSPVALVILGLAGASLGAKAAETIPFTRRIIERRAAQRD
ncbi:hypothetical protein [Nonomuraea longicatena]|uniref:Uncharacterized protein n=1 Tax=Nonomuraea longicatena TaxID=83682 RepID=A0ABN1P661_9ACTN